ncbi:MAG: DUF4386 family protein [Dehalococcoidia bacterium]
MSELRWAGIAGILFAILFTFGFLTAGDAPTGEENSDAEVNEYYEDSGNRQMLVTVAYLLSISALALVVFSRLGPYSLLRDSSESLTRHLGALGMTGAVLAAAAIFLGGIAFATVAAGVEFQDDAADPGVARFLNHFGYGAVLIWGGLAGAFSVASFAWGALRSATMPAWLGWLGLLCAVILLAAVVFIPMIALPLWVLVAGIWFLAKPTALPATSPATA